MASTDAALLQKAFSLLKKQGRSIYIDDDDREKTFKPMPFSADLPLAFVFLSVSFSLRNVVEAKNLLFRALLRWFFKKIVGLRLHKCFARSATRFCLFNFRASEIVFVGVLCESGGLSFYIFSTNSVIAAYERSNVFRNHSHQTLLIIFRVLSFSK